MYLLAFIGLIALTRAVFRNRNEEGNADKVFVQVLLCASFLGGFLCYVLWEAKGIYTLPFYLLLVPMAAYGIQTAVAWGKTRPSTASSCRKTCCGTVITEKIA